MGRFIIAFQDSGILLPILGCFILFVLYTLTKLLVSALQISKKIRQNGCKPPPSYPHADPVFGLDAFILSLKYLAQGRLMDDIDSRFKTINGGANTFSINSLGSTVIYTIEPENVKTIFATNFKDFGIPKTRKDALAIFGPGIFSSDGHHWEASRALLRPNFVRNQVGDMESLEKHVSALIGRIPRDGRAVDMQDLFSDLTLDSATELLLGESTGILLRNPRPEAVKFQKALNETSEGISIRMGIGWLATIIPDPKFHRGITEMKEFVNIYVSRAMQLREGKEKEVEGGRYVFLPELAKSGYSRERIAAELMAVIVAGRGSIAALLTVFWFTVARRPDVFYKLRNEVLQALGSQMPSFEELKSLKYLNWTLREIQRLYPAIPVNSRVALIDTILPLGGGQDGKSPIYLKKGTRVLHFPYSMHRRTDIYGLDAMDFKPERWEHLRTSWEYLPFSGGPRTCIGQQLALTEASYTVVRMLQTLKSVEPGDESVWQERLVLAMSVRSGCCVKFTPA